MLRFAIKSVFCYGLSAFPPDYRIRGTSLRYKEGRSMKKYRQDRGRNQFRIRLVVLPFILALVNQPATGLSGPDFNEEGTRFLGRLVGSWLGEGKANGKMITDELKFEWVLSNKFLQVYSRSRDGDTFEAQGYFWYDEKRRHFEFHEFSNSEWPIRIMKGGLIKDRLTLEEHTPDRHVRIVFELVDDNTLMLTEGHIQKEKVDLFVQETFRRKSTAGK